MGVSLIRKVDRPESEDEQHTQSVGRLLTRIIALPPLLFLFLQHPEHSRIGQVGRLSSRAATHYWVVGEVDSATKTSN